MQAYSDLLCFIPTVIHQSLCCAISNCLSWQCWKEKNARIAAKSQHHLVSWERPLCSEGNSHSNTAYSVAAPLWPQQCRETGRVGRSSISLQVFIFIKTAVSIGGLVFCYVHNSDGIYQSISGLDCPTCHTEPYTDRQTWIWKLI